MTDNNKSYYVQLPDKQRGEIWDADKYSRNQQQLFNDHPDAIVLETSPFTSDTEPKEGEFYSVHLPGYNKAEMWDADKLARNKEKLLKDHPDVNISRGRTVDYWGDRLRETDSAIAPLEKRLGEIDDELSSPDIRVGGFRRADAVRLANEKNNIGKQLEGLYADRDNNYLYRKQREAQAKMFEDEDTKLSEMQKQLSDENPDAEKARRASLVGGGAGPLAASAQVFYGKDSDPEFNRDAESLALARIYLDEAKKTAFAPSKYDRSNGFANFFRGLQGAAPESISVVNLIKTGLDMHLVDAIKKIQETAGEDANIFDLVKSPDKLTYLSSAEKELVKAFCIKSAVDAERAGDLSIGYQAGGSAMRSLGFMADFLMFGGEGSLANAAGKKATEGLLKATAKASNRLALKGMARKAALAPAKFGIGTLEAAVKTAVMTPMMPSSWTNLTDNLLSVNDAGQVDLSGKAILNAIGDTFIENLSENAGEQVEAIIDAPFKLAGKAMSKVIPETKFTDWAKIFRNSGASRLMRDAAWHGYFGEIGEEWYGNALRVMTGVDKDALKNFATVDQQLITLISFAPMSVFGMGTSAGQYLSARKGMNKSAERLSALLSQNGYDEAQIKDILDVTKAENPTQLAAKLSPVITQVAEDNATEDSGAQIYRAVCDYAQAVARYRVFDGIHDADVSDQRNAMANELSDRAGLTSIAQTHDAGNGVTYETVRTLTDPDVGPSYVVGEQDGKLAIVQADNGRKYFIPKEQIGENVIDSGEMPLNDFLDREIARKRSASEAERIETDRKQQAQEIFGALNIGDSINVGTEEDPAMGMVIAKQPDGRTVIQLPDGSVNEYTPSEIGNLIGKPISSKTDEQIETEAADAEQEVDDAVRWFRDARYSGDAQGLPFVMADGSTVVINDVRRGESTGSVTATITTSDGQETTTELPAKSVNEAILGNSAVTDEAETKDDSTPRDFRGNPLPLKEDGNIDQTALWNNDPEAWAMWNDSVRNDGGENSLAYIETAAGKLKKDIKNIDKEYAKTTDFDKRDSLEGTRKNLQERLAALDAVRARYAERQNAEAAAKMQAGIERAREARKAKADELAKYNTESLEGINKKWEDAPKDIGTDDVIVLPNGEEVGGNYVLTEAFAPTPSHDTEKGYAKTEGFPVDENGQTVNDRDYEHDKEAQRQVEQKAASYDQRALQTPVVVSNDGVVLSGNDRTMASQLAARQGTDTKYNEYLAKHPQKYGFTAEQVAKYSNPRVVFVPTESMPYTASTFAKFNAEEKKTQSKTESAVKAGKTITPETVATIAQIIDAHESIAETYADEKAVATIIRTLVDAGTVQENEISRLMDGNLLSGTGEDLVESVLLGAVMREDALRCAMGDKAIRRSIMSALTQLLKNNTYGEYSLSGEFSDAVVLLYQAKHSGLVKGGESIANYMNQPVLEGFGENPLAAATVQMIANTINGTKVNGLKNVLSLYNAKAEMAASGQADLFLGDVETKEQIIREILNEYGYDTETFTGEQQQSTAAAAEQPEQQPEQSEQGSSEEQAPDAVSGDAGSSNEITPEQSPLPGQPNSDQYPTERESSDSKSTQSSETKQENAEISEGRSIQGLEGYSREQIKGIVSDHIRETLSDAGINAEIVGVEIHGSRNRGNAREDSDLDIVVEYRGDIREDDMFNTLNDAENQLIIDGIKVDINPIRAEETGTLQDYMKRSKEYDQNKAEEEPQPEAKNEGQFGLVSDERMAELKKRLLEKIKGQLNSGFDPELLSIGMEMAAGYIDRGIKTFVDFSKAMIADFGDLIRPYLKAFYNGARDMPGMQDLAKEMDGYDLVLSTDINTIGKEETKAEPKVEEAKAEKEEGAQTGKTTLGKVIADKDTRDNSDIWLVQPSERVSTSEFKSLKTKAKENNGYWSSFKKAFLFKNEQDANKFNNIDNGGKEQSDEPGRNSGSVQINDERRANTAAAVLEAGSVASEAEAIAEDEGRAAVTSTRASAAVSKVDRALDKVNSELALLGYYVADEVQKDFNEMYGYTRNAEKKAVKDANRLAKKLSFDLGVEVKAAAKANIAPIGGDIIFRLQLTDGSDLYVNISVEPNSYGHFQEDGGADDLGVGSIMYRAETGNNFGTNIFLPPYISYKDMLADIRSNMSDRLPEQPTTEDILKNAEIISQNSKKAKKTSQKERDSQEKPAYLQDGNDLMGNLFGDLFDNEDVQGKATETEPQAEPTKVASITPEENGLQGIYGVRSSGLRSDDSGHEGRLTEESGEIGERTGQDSGRTDGQGMGSGFGENRDSGSRLGHSVEDSTEQNSVETVSGSDDGSTAPASASETPTPKAKKKNTRNNSVARGVEYAPKTPSERFKANIEAIKLMKELTTEERPATRGEMEVLRKYTGWGGLGTFFNNRYSKEYRELSSILTPEELQSAEYSINTAYFTPSGIIDTLWDIAKRLGFKGGNILEGSAGIGNMLASMPKSISENSDISAVELDTITGNMLKLLYPDADVQIKGFQDADIENNSVDLAITNVPFGTDISVYDAKEKDITRKFGNRIHDFCIAKNIRKLREGGIGIFITTNGTLDRSRALRNWVVNEGNADFIGAFRLNNQTFGGTPVTSDILIVRKRVNGNKSPNAIDVNETSRTRSVEIKGEQEWNQKAREWITPTREVPMEYNSYFVQHPEYMAGEMKFGQEAGDTFRPSSVGLYPDEKKPQDKLLAKWAKQLQNSAKEETASVEGKAESESESTVGVKEGQIVVNSKGEICLSRRGKAVPIETNNNKVKGHTKEQVVKDYDALKTAINNVLYYQTKHSDDDGLKPLLDELNRAYDDFTSKYGNLNKNTALSFLRNDVDFPSVAALEDYKEDVNPDGKKEIKVSKTDIFNKRVVGFNEEPHPANVKDGVIVSINREGKINIPYIAGETGLSEEQVRKEVIASGLGFVDPATGKIEVRYEYLSGNVREKLEYAKEHNNNGEYDENIKALEKVIPADIPAHLINFTLGSDWIDGKFYTDYAKERFGLNDNFTPSNIGGVWGVPQYLSLGQTNEQNRAAGVISEKTGIMVMGHELMLAAMNNTPVRFAKTKKNFDGTTETITDPEATNAAQAKIEEMRQDFCDWAKEKIMKDNELAQKTSETYNRLFNAIVPKEIGDEFLPERFPGSTTQRTLYPHQKKAVIRGTTEPVLLAHEVGTGKSYTLISTAMELRRLGLAKKPMIVVQNATVGQFVGDAKLLYPNSKILTVSDADRTAAGRAAFYAKIKYNDWDMIVVPQSVFEMIPDSEERQRAFIQEKIDEKMHVIELAKQSGMDSRSVSSMEKELKNLRAEYEEGEVSKGNKRDAKKEAKTKENAAARAKQQLDRKTDDVSNFDEMGIDALLIDEAHAYKHLGFSTQMQRGVKGVDPSYSKRSAGVYLKLQSIFSRVGRRNVVFATGTPISNTAAEIWTFMKYLLSPDVMKANHIYYFDDFVRNFGRIAQTTEFTTSGKYKETTRFSGYINLPELVRTWSSVADTVLSKDAKDAKGKDFKDKLPEIEGGKAEDIFLPQSPSLVGIMNFVKAKLDEFDKMSGKEKREHSSIPLVMYGIAQRAAIDPRLVDRDAADEPLSKTNKAVEEILKDLKQTESYKGTCAVFCDNYRRLDATDSKDKVEGFNLFKEMKRKLVENGVPEEQIVIMESGMSVNKKQQIFDKVIDGDVRVIMGTTQTLGTGVNIQTRLHAVIHMDAPNRPMDYTQRNGRILRQGNLHKEWGKTVRIIRFGVEDSLDVTAYQRLKTKSEFIDAIMNGKPLLTNAMEGRTIEEPDEGLFDNAVAQLSGSQYAIKVSAAEREIRKLNSQKLQYEQDQIYIERQLRTNEAKILRFSDYVKDHEKALSLLKDTFKGGKVSKVSVEGKAYSNEESLNEALKEKITKPVREYLEENRKNYLFKDGMLSFNLSFDGIDATVNVLIKKIEDYSAGKGFMTRMSTEMTYNCPVLKIEGRKVAGNAIKEMVSDFRTEVATGKYSQHGIEALQNSIERMEHDNSLMRERRGKPFKDEEKLKDAQSKLQEYQKLMKEEMDAKEAKYANVATAGVHSDELNGEVNALLDSDGNSEEAEFEIENDEDYISLESAPEKQLAFDTVSQMLSDAGIPVEHLSDDAMRQMAEASQDKGEAELLARSNSPKARWLNNYVEAVHLVTGEDKKSIRKKITERIAEARREAKELYANVLSGNFNSLTLRQINNYIDNATNKNRFIRPLSQRLPERALAALSEGGRTSAVDALFSRICESTVPANGRTRAEARRAIETRKEELLEGWAKATGNWHESIADFTGNTAPIKSGTDSDVYLSDDGGSVIKASKGKFDNRKFPSDIDQVNLFNAVFPHSAYRILGYGRLNGKFVRFIEQQFVDFSTSQPLTTEERVEYMRRLGFEPRNEEKTVFSNGEIVVSDLQKSNIVKDTEGNIRVIDADVKLHTKDIGGNYTYPPVETDTEVPEFMTVYHGSGAKFDRFDHSHMGEGEGEQAFGWGTYVTEVEGIGKSYAKNISQSKLNFKHALSARFITSLKRYMGEGLSFQKAKQNLIEVVSNALKNQLTSKDSYYSQFQHDFQVLKDMTEEDMPKEILYTVDIPENRGNNYLDWNKKINETETDILTEIDNKLYNEEGWHRVESGDLTRFTKGKETIVLNPNATGADIYEELSVGLGSPKTASEFLNSLGYIGISYPAEYMSGGRRDGARNYVIFDENNAKITDRIEFLKNGDTVYGAAVGGKIFLNADRLNPNTPIHEYTHLWDKACKARNPELWKRGVELMKQTSLWKEVENDPNYAGLDEDGIAGEVHARLSGEHGAETLERLSKEAIDENGSLAESAMKASVIGRLRKWLSEFWHWVKDTMTPWSREEAEKVSIEDFINMPLADLAKGTKLNDNQYNSEERDIIDNAKKDGTFMKAPNGNPTNLNERQWVQVRTEAFKEWFGDWENDPENASKAVDENGEPKVLYHGGPYRFFRFDPARLGQSTDANSAREGFFFTDSQDLADVFAENSLKTLPEDDLDSLVEARINEMTGDELEDAYIAYRNEDDSYQDYIDETESPSDEDFLKGYNYDYGEGYKDGMSLDDARRAFLWNAIATKLYGGYFSDIEDIAEELSTVGVNLGNTEAVFLNLRTPAVDEVERDYFHDGEDIAPMTPTLKEAKENGRDGAIFTGITENGQEGPAFQYVVFNPNQIKSAVENSGKFSADNDDIRFSIVTDKDEIDRLNSKPTIKVYRAMQLVNGKLYPPMSGKVNGKWRDGIAVEDLGKVWEKADENPELADDKGRFTLNKGNGTTLKARYNPYIHTSTTPLNDQFSSAQSRPELVTVEVEIPKSELTSGYKADKAKDSVGKVEWKAGVVQGKLSGTRTVILSRWDKPVRIVPESEVADKIVEMFDGKDITMPSNVVTPALRAELERRGVPFVETDNQGKPTETTVRFREDGKSLFKAMQDNAEVLTPRQLTKEIWDKEVNGKTFNTPVGEVRLGSNQYVKNIKKGREKEFGMLIPTIERPDIIFEENAPEPGAERQTKYAFVKTFVDTNGERHLNYTSISVKKNDMEVVESSHFLRDKQVLNKIEKEHILWNRFASDSALSAQGGSIVQSNALSSRAKVGNEFEKTNESSENQQDIELDREGERSYDSVPTSLNHSESGKRYAAEETASAIGVKVEYISRDEMPKGHENAKGMWKDGKIYIALENHPDANDVRRTVLHEAVGHEGLRRLVGERNMNGFCMDVYKALPASERRKIADAALQRYGGDVYEATEEYLAELAEDMDTNKSYDTILDEIRVKTRNLLSKIGINIPLSRRDIRWILWQSYNANRQGDLINEAQRQVLADRLGFSLRADSLRAKAQEEIRLRSANGGNISAANIYNNAVARASKRLHESWVEMTNSVNTLVEAIEKQTGKAAKSFEDIRLALNQQSSKELAAIKAWERDFYNPMMSAIKEMMDAHRLKREEIDRYAFLKHGLERNDVFAKRDAKAYYQSRFEKNVKKINGDKRLSELEKKLKIADAEQVRDSYFADIDAGTDKMYLKFREKDYGGLTALFSTFSPISPQGENETDEEYNARVLASRKPQFATLAETEDAARAEVDAFEKRVGKASITKLWDATNKATKSILKHQYESNMISREQYTHVKDMFKYYVPMRGFADNTASDMYSYYASDKGSITPPLLRAKGRKTQAESPWGYIGAMASTAYAADFKNETKLALFYFISNRPDNDLVRISDVWYEKTSETDPDTGKPVFKQVYPEFKDGLNAAATRQEYDRWEADMEEKRKKGEAYKGTNGIDLQNSVIHIDEAQKNSHIIRFKVRGQEKMLLINGNPRAAQAINNELNIDAAQDGITKGAQKILRWMAGFNTSYNPEFWMSNAQRDLLFSIMATSIKESPEYTRQFIANLGRAVKVIGMFRKDKQGKLGSSYIEKMYKEFVDGGAVTGFTVIKDNEEWEQVGRQFTADRNKAGQAAMQALEAIQDFGEGIEQMTRFAAFLTARENGKSITEAVADAKELTVNFNRKGSGKGISWKESEKLKNRNGEKLNTAERVFYVGASMLSGYGRRFIMFFNASVQGLNTMYQLWTKDKRRTSAWMAGYFALGAINAMLHALLDDDDDYLDMPDYERRNNLLLGGKGNYFKWALPQESRVFYAMGDILVNDMILGRNPQKKTRGVGDILEAVGDIMPINPMNGLRDVVPQALVPAFENLQNEDYKGTKVYNEPRWLSEEEQKRTPKYTMAYSNTGRQFVLLSMGLNYISGGDSTDAGAIDIRPEKMEHLFEGLTGGLGTTLNRFWKSTGGLVIDSAIDANESGMNFGDAIRENASVRNTPFLNRLWVHNDDRYRNVHTSDVFNYYKAEAEHTQNLIRKAKKEGDADLLDRLYDDDKRMNILYIYRGYSGVMKAYDRMLKITDDKAERRQLIQEQDEYRKEMIQEIAEENK